MDIKWLISNKLLSYCNILPCDYGKKYKRDYKIAEFCI